MTVYLDHNATTPLDRRVRQAAEPWLSEHWGNPSSREHRWGWDAADGIEEARNAVRHSVGDCLQQVTFVSGSTEALNTVLRSYVGLGKRSEKWIVTCATEHDAVLAPSRYLAQRANINLLILPVDRLGHLDTSVLAVALERVAGALVVVMAANNEIGTVHPTRRIAEVAHAAGCAFLCDTTQAFGKLEVSLSAGGMDFATISAHKIHGPKGVGALLVRRGLEQELEPLILGGGQEHGRRGGTLNVPGIVGFGEACRLVEENLKEETMRIGLLRDRLEDGIFSQVPRTWVNGDRANRLCNTTNIGFKGVDARTMIRDMHDVAVSTRSACSSGNSGPSHVLKAIGLSDEDAYSCIRFSIGRFTTQEEIDYAIGKVVTSAHKLRHSKSA